jgi:hypothetical protein
VAGHIELGNHANSAFARECHDVADLFLGVILAVGTQLLEVGVELALDAKSLIV